LIKVISPQVTLNTRVEMINTVQIIEIEDSLGFILPQDVLDRLGVKAEDTLYLTETPDGFELRPDFTKK
jgi:hypothetical protein